MTHISRNPKKLLSRVRRIGGQVAALEKALQEGGECAQVLVQIAAVRGAVHGLMLETVSEYLLEHVAVEADEQRRSAEARIVIDLMRTYAK